MLPAWEEMMGTFIGVLIGIVFGILIGTIPDGESVQLIAENEALRKLAHDYIQAYEKLAFGDALLTKETP